MESLELPFQVENGNQESEDYYESFQHLMHTYMSVDQSNGINDCCKYITEGRNSHHVGRSFLLINVFFFKFLLLDQMVHFVIEEAEGHS